MGSTGVIREGAGYMLPEHTRLQERVCGNFHRCAWALADACITPVFMLW